MSDIKQKTRFAKTAFIKQEGNDRGIIMNLSKLIAKTSHDGYQAVTIYASQSGLCVHRERNDIDSTAIDAVEYPGMRISTASVMALEAKDGLRAIGWEVRFSLNEIHFYRNSCAAGRAYNLLASKKGETERQAA